MSDLPLVAVAGVVAGISQGVSGFGLSVVLAPVLQLGSPGASGVRVTNSVGGLVNAVLLSRTWRQAQVRTALLIVVPGVIVGAAITPVLHQLGARTISLVAGAVTLVAVLVALADRHPPWVGGDRGAAAADALSGAMTVAAGAGGPPVAVHVATRRWDVPAVIATGQLIFLPLNIVAVVVSTARIPGDVFGTTLGGVAVGLPLGFLLQGRLSPAIVRRMVLLIGLVGSVVVLVRAA